MWLWLLYTWLCRAFTAGFSFLRTGPPPADDFAWGLPPVTEQPEAPPEPLPAEPAPRPAGDDMAELCRKLAAEVQELRAAARKDEDLEVWIGEG